MGAVILGQGRFFVADFLQFDLRSYDGSLRQSYFWARFLVTFAIPSSTSLLYFSYDTFSAVG
ncbi:hypothetical protein NON20_07390 [Synechocystis sp. B12]|nr:hypothetical protein NON20_07390 [Synechocystis sp. B12]